MRKTRWSALISVLLLCLLLTGDVLSEALLNETAYTCCPYTLTVCKLDGVLTDELQNNRPDFCKRLFKLADLFKPGAYDCVIIRAVSETTSGPLRYTSANEVTVSVAHLTEHPMDIEVIALEFVHDTLQYSRSTPLWLTEYESALFGLRNEVAGNTGRFFC